MRKQLNVKFLVGLLAAAVLLGAGLYFLYVFQVNRHAASLLARIDRAEEEGDVDRLTRYLERYLALKPDDGNALARYGLLLVRQADSPSARARALATLDEVLRRRPERDDVRRSRVPVAMEMRQFAKARDDLAVLVQASPEDGELADRLGECEQALGEPAKAAEWFSQAIDHTPTRIDAYVRLAGLLRGPLAEPERADEVMDRMIAANDQSAEAYLARGARYRQEFQSAEEAAKDVDQARVLDPNNADGLLASARLAEGAGNLDEARRRLQHGLELHPDNGPLYTTLAAVEQKAGRHSEALACLRQGLAAVSESGRHELLLGLLELRIQGGESAEAEEVLAQLRRGAPSPLLDFHEARLLVQRNQWRQAASILRRVRPQLVSSPDLGVSLSLLLAECSGRLGDADQELEAYQGAVIAGPRSSAAHVGLGAALLARGRAADATAELRLAVTARGAPASSWGLLAKALILQNLGLPAAGRKWEEVTQTLDRAAQADPASVEPTVLRAEALVAQGQVDQARKVLREARDRRPDQAPLWVAGIELEADAGKADAADALLKQAEEKMSGRVEWPLARVGLLARRGRAALPDVGREEQELKKYSPADQERLLESLAAAYLRLGEPASSERLWDRLAECRPGDLGVRLLLFDADLESGRDEEGRRLLVEMKAIEGEEGTWWRYGEAALRIARAARGEKEDLDQAAKDLADVAERRPGWSRVLVAEAEICDLRGRPDDALEKYQQAVNLGDRQPAVARRLVDLLFERQRYVEADRVIRELQQGASLPVGLGQRGVRAAFETQNHERALALARQAATDRPNEYRNHLWLGLSLWAVGRRADAEDSLRRAVQLSGAPDAWVALVQFLTATGRPADAEVAVREAEAKLPPAEAALPLAQCYESIGRQDRAEAAYQAALAVHPNSGPLLRTLAAFYLRVGQAAKAEPVLTRLIDASGEASAPDVAWGRRNLAVVRAAHGDYRALPGGAGSTGPQPPAQRSGNGRGSARSGDGVGDAPLPPAGCLLRAGGARRARQFLTADDQFLLARLHESQGQWAEADRWMETLLAADETNRPYLAYLARSKLHRKDAAGARPYLDKLEKWHPESWETTEVHARMLQAQGKGNDAVALVEERLDRRDWNLNPQPPPWPEAFSQFGRLLILSGTAPVPQSPPCTEMIALLEKVLNRRDKPEDREAVGAAAALFDDLGQFDAAERRYREYVSRSARPESVLLLAAFLGRRHRVPEALDLCERAWQTCPPGAVAAASTALLRAWPPDARQIERVKVALEAAIRKGPEAPALLLSLADLRDLQGRYEEAEALYRRVLHIDPDNVKALNNLAWLLAQRDGAVEALDLINRAIEGFGPEPPLLDTRAVVYLAAGRTESAQADLREAIAQAAEPSYSFHLARACLQAKDSEAAAEALGRARAAGFKPNALHPLERPIYPRVLAELGEE